MEMDILRIVKGLKKRFRQIPLLYPKKTKTACRWGIIGLGNMAEVFATALDEDQDSIIAAVASRSLDKAQLFANKHGRGKAYGSYDEMLLDDALQLDVVYIATPAKYHAEHIKLCLETGHNVLCEKPLSIHSSELSDLYSIAEERHLFMMEGMWMKCLPSFLKAHEWLENGEIGRLELVKVDFYKREIVNPSRSIFNACEGGGLVNDYGVYAIAFVLSFLGGKPDILRFEKRKSFLGIDTDWQIFAERNGIKAFVSLSSNFKGASKAAIIGTNGVVEWDAQFNRTNHVVCYDKYGKQRVSFETAYKCEGFEYEIEEVKRCIRSGNKQSDAVSLNDTLDTIQVLEYLNEFERNGE